MLMSDGPWKDTTATPEMIMERYELLSPQERRVLEVLMEGHSVHDVGVMLCKAPSTISTYKARIMRKMRVHNEMQLAQLGLRVHYERRVRELTTDAYAASMGM